MKIVDKIYKDILAAEKAAVEDADRGIRMELEPLTTMNNPLIEDAACSSPRSPDRHHCEHYRPYSDDRHSHFDMYQGVCCYCKLQWRFHV